MEETQISKSWYVLSTLYGKEQLAEDTLRSREIEVWYPKIRKTVPNGEAVKRVVKPLFPRYIFARFALEESYRIVRYARGVLDFLRFGDEFAKIEASDVDAILANTIDGYVVTENREIDPAFGFAIDEIVKVVGFSVWSGRIGKYKGASKDGTTIKVEIPATNLGKAINISVPVNCVCSA